MGRPAGSVHEGGKRYCEPVPPSEDIRYVHRKEARKRNREFLRAQIAMLEQVRDRCGFLTSGESARLRDYTKRLFAYVG